MRNYRELRKKYPTFVYQDYSYKLRNRRMEVSFAFKIEPDIFFNPKVIISNVKKEQLKRIGEFNLRNLIFHLGLIESISYWKSTCSPKIVIRTGCLNKKQIRWWKNLIINGLGQFFYENNINLGRSDFLFIVSEKESRKYKALSRAPRDKNKVLVPIGGGKDSIVSLEILKKSKKKIGCFCLNPSPPSKKIIRVAGCREKIFVSRTIDKNLLKLNQRGFLNGHTPYSAYLSFLSVLLAAIFDYRYIAFSNERSANEGNVRYLGRVINHQYSKSFNFEKGFRDYCKRYLIDGVDYFSLLRPLYEIQIARMFSGYPKYHSIFVSCNEAFKTFSGIRKPSGKWCGRCAKCLFVFTILYPFVSERKIVKIFQKNLFDDKKLLKLMKELTGERKVKPFECVGTRKESLSAFYLSWQKANKKKELPFLLKYFQQSVLPKHPKLEKEAKRILNAWSNRHNLPREFERLIKSNLKPV